MESFIFGGQKGDLLSERDSKAWFLWIPIVQVVFLSNILNYVQIFVLKHDIDTSRWIFFKDINNHMDAYKIALDFA